MLRLGTELRLELEIVIVRIVICVARMGREID